MREGEEKGDLATFFLVKQDNFFKLIIFFSTNCDDDGFQIGGNKIFRRVFDKELVLLPKGVNTRKKNQQNNAFIITFSCSSSLCFIFSLRIFLILKKRGDQLSAF